MHIEKINDQKIKCILTREDLIENDIKISELAFGADNAQELFMNMIEEAYEKFGFDPDNGPLMIEAIPLNDDSLMVILTKVNSPNDIENRLDGSEYLNSSTKKKGRKKSTRTGLFYRFDDLEEIILLAKRVSPLAFPNSIYTHENNYYLLIEEMLTRDINKLESIISEYGEKYTYHPMVKGWLNEYAETLIAKDALLHLEKL